MKTSKLLGCILAFCMVLTPIAMAEEAYSPTTGTLTDQPYRPVLAIISNSVEARPARGLAAADIVYDLYEGTWRRTNAGEACAYYGADGNPLTLYPGNAYILIVSAEVYDAADISGTPGTVVFPDISAM